MAVARHSIKMENIDAERARQDDHLQKGNDSGALDLSTRRASLDAGLGLTGDELLARVLEKRGLREALFFQNQEDI